MSKRNRLNSVDEEENKVEKVVKKETVLTNHGVFDVISKHLTMRDLLPMQRLNRQTYKKMVPEAMKNHRNGYEKLDIGLFVVKDNILYNFYSKGECDVEKVEKGFQKQGH